ncbi:transglutaminase domain-containing protein [Acetivibrio ethanolgignens]|uniref:Transglutaminase-like domain-containing protein n=1 Tax=Acetivibrio ethanolgignens TaxID=290052 RepID=A0A0V8QI62_9FIRM|nr:transglutaminase domain-containing protein [Acetivibrio ethanolgignens]KSV60247.1 hypothetical protein ASU35_17145 [Acetivibrio ethanolgignens]
MKKSKLFTIITLAIAILTTTLTPVTSAATAQAATKKKFVAGDGSFEFGDVVMPDVCLDADEPYTLWVGREWRDKIGYVKHSKISQKNYKKYKVTFKSSNKKVATVSSKGVVTGKNGGKCTITVSSKYGKAKVSVYVDDTYKQLLKIMKEQIGPNVEQLSDFEKVHVAMLWINGNIDYQRTFREEHDSMTTISRGYGMCHDQAILLRDMCEALGMEAECYLNEEINPNHEWNRVKVDGKWWEVDPSNHCLPSITEKVEVSEKYWTGIKITYHPLIQGWDAKRDELEPELECHKVNGEPELFYHGEMLQDIPGTHEHYLEELKVKVGHDKVDHTKYQDLFVWENANWY